MKTYNDMHAAAMDKYTKAAKDKRRVISAHRGLVSNQDPGMEERADYNVHQPKPQDDADKKGKGGDKKEEKKEE